MSNPYVGEIRLFAGNFAPQGWFFCQGQTLPISEYDVLFNLIGITYGGDGQQTFTRAAPSTSGRAKKQIPISDWGEGRAPFPEDRLPDGGSGGSARVVPDHFGTNWAAEIGNRDVRMKADHVKTTATTEEVSSHPGEKGHWSQKWRRNTSRAGKKPMADWKNDLQICGAGRKSRKSPTQVVGKKPNGKSQMTSCGSKYLFAYASLKRLFLLVPLLMLPAVVPAQSTVNLATGSYTYSHVDLRIPSPGLSFEFKRFYNSQNTASTGPPLGFGWTHSYNVQLSVTSPNSEVVITFGDGHQESYSTNGAGGYVSEAGVFNSLTTGGGIFTLTTKAQQKYIFDAEGRLTSIVDKNANSVTLIYSGSNLITITDPVGRTINFSYNANGCLTQITDPLGRTVQFVYDSSTNLISVTDPRGGVTQFSYNANHQIIQAIDPLGNTFVSLVYNGTGVVSSQTDALGDAITFSYNFVNGIATVTDAKGNVSYNHYDGQLRLVETDDSLGSRQLFSYDANNNQTQVVDKNGNTTAFSYDAFGNLTRITDPLGNITSISFDSKNNPTALVNAKGSTTSFSYDSHGNLTGTTDPLGNSTTMAYDPLGRRIQSRNALGRVTSFFYDAAGDLVKFTDPAGGTVNYTYDIVGNRLSTTDPKGNTTSYIVDSLNRLVRTTDPAGGVAQFTYDAVGNLISRIDPNGKTTACLYNANNHLASISYPTGQAVTFAYDSNGNRTTMTDALGTTAYSYDALNRLSNVTDCYGKSVGYGYDANGNRTSVTYPGSKTVQYGYDAMNRLTRVLDWLGNTTIYSYDADGQLTGAANSNGTGASYQYDTAGRLISLNNSAANSAIISSYQYSLDAAGDQAHVSQIALVQSMPVGDSFTNAYDNDNRLIMSEGQTQTFDANGNLLSTSGTNLFAYDYENRLTQSVSVGTTNTYQYDGLGNRMSASRNGALTRYVLDRNSPLPPVLSETDSGGNITAYYVYGLGLISRIDAGGNVRYYHFDSRGSTIALSDATGRILEAYAYDPYGKPINQINSTNRFRYLGRHGVMDEANGFLYFGSRYYATEVGRFITKASTTGKDGDSQSLNQYIYALNNPVNAGFPIPMAKPPAPGAEAIENTSLNVINAAGNGDGSGSCNLVPDLLR